MLIDRERAEAEQALADRIAGIDPALLGSFVLELPPDDRAMVSRVMAERLAAGWRGDPLAMAAHLDDRVRDWAYLRLLSDAFVRAVSGESPRQIWNLPSRMGKTTILRWGVVWGLDRAPWSRWIWTTYGDGLAHESAVTIRDTLRVHAGELRAQLQQDRQRADRVVTDQGGGVLGAGVNATIIGFGCGDGGGLIVDDPMKNWQEAHSQTASDRLWNQYLGTLRHRLDSEDAPIIVCHARWHEDDITGRLIQGTEDDTGERWEVINLAAIAEEGRPDPLNRQPGEVLEPERFPLEAVKARHHAMGSYLVSALEQQAPAPAEGRELLREWFVLATSSELPTRPDLAVTSWDTKLKDKEAGDYVVGQCWWRVAGGFWLMDQIRGQYDHATTANAMALLAVRNPYAHVHHIEAAGSAPEVVAELRRPIDGYVVSDEMAERLAMTPEERDKVAVLRRRGMANLLPNPPKGDKSVRARSYIAPHAEAGHVRFPEDAPWVPALLDEIAAFPEGSHDDQVDAMSQALQKLAQGDAGVAAPVGRIERARPGERTRAPVPGVQRARVVAPR